MFINLHFNYRVAKILRPIRQTRLSVMKHIFALARVDVHETDSHSKIRSLSAENSLKIFPQRTACGGVFLSDFSESRFLRSQLGLLLFSVFDFHFSGESQTTIHSVVECFVRLLLASFPRKACINSLLCFLKRICFHLRLSFLLIYR